MVVCHKEEKIIYQVYDISKDNIGNIAFLVYKDNEWVYDLADKYTPNFTTEYDGNINSYLDGEIVLY